jgi:FO synthase
MRRVTFSRNYTLSLSRTCQCYCKYCAFATHRAHIHDPEEVERRLDEAVRRNAKELLVLTGERPEVNPEVAERLRGWGHEDFTSYVIWACQQGIERGLLPHTNLGVLAHEDLARLREVSASQGLMLESVSERLMQTVHAGSPTKHPAKRLETMRLAESCDPVHDGDPVGLRARGAVAAPRRSPRSTPSTHPGGHPPELRSSSALTERRSRRSRTRPQRSDGRTGRRSALSCRCRSGRIRSRWTR